MSTETQVQTPVEQQAREITLWSTKNNRKSKLTSTATTWGELKKEIAAKGEFSIDGLLATENQKRTDLANDLAILPESNFVIYFRAKETKSGAEMSYKELRGGIKEIIERDGDVAKAHFNEGKNYTTKSTEELRSLYDSYKPATKSEAPVAEEAVVEEVAPQTNVADVVESVVKAKSITNQDRITIIRENLTAIKESCNDDDISDRVEMASDEIDGLESALIDNSYADLVSGEVAVEKQTEATPVAEEPKESEEDRIAREKREADAEEDRRLAEEAKQLQSGFKK